MTRARWLWAVVAVVALSGCAEVADDGTVEMSNTAPGDVSTFWVDTVNDRRIPCVWAAGTNRGGLSCDWSAK
jgi:hypothetical protein